MSRRALAMLFALALLAGLVATLPLRLALIARSGSNPETPGLSIAGTSGAIWSGRLRSVEWRGHPLADVDVALDPMALLAGVLEFRLSTREWSADVLRGRYHGIDNASGELRLAMQAPLADAVVQLSLSDVALLFADDRCSRAGGTIQADITGLGPPLRLSGPVRCDGRTGTVILASAPGAGVPRIEADLEIDHAGRYRLHSRVRATDDVSALALRSAGFRPASTGLVRIDSGWLHRP